MALLPTSVPANFSTAATYGDQNTTNGSWCPTSEISDWHSTVLPVYILLIAVLGILLNVFVLMVFGLHKKACTVAEIYLSNLAAADLILMLVLPFWAVYAAKTFNWPFGTPLCRLVSFTIAKNVHCSIYFLVLISIDRYVALVYPMSHGRLRCPKYAKLGCLLVWCFGLVLGAPTLVFRKVKDFQDYGIACYLDYPNHSVELLFEGILFIFGFIIPILVLSFCTVKIIQALKTEVMFNDEKSERKATNLMLAVLLAFLICWVPFHVVSTLNMLIRVDVLEGCDLEFVLDICNQIFAYLAFFNSVLNPILYVIVGENFREKVRELFEHWRIRRTSTTESSRSSNLRSFQTCWAMTIQDG